MAIVTVTVVGTAVVTVTMEAVVDLVEESALSVASQVILLGNVLVKVAEETDMEAGMIGMAAAVEVEEDVMVLIGMVTVQGDVAEILVVGEGIDIVVTVLAHMTAGVQEVSDLDEMIPQNYAEELEDPRLLDASVGTSSSRRSLLDVWLEELCS